MAVASGQSVLVFATKVHIARRTKTIAFILSSRSIVATQNLWLRKGSPKAFLSSQDARYTNVMPQAYLSFHTRRKQRVMHEAMSFA
jgi:hypothetical protein